MAYSPENSKSTICKYRVYVHAKRTVCVGPELPEFATRLPSMFPQQESCRHGQTNALKSADRWYLTGAVTPVPFPTQRPFTRSFP